MTHFNFRSLEAVIIVVGTDGFTLTHPIFALAKIQRRALDLLSRKSTRATPPRVSETHISPPEGGRSKLDMRASSMANISWETPVSNEVVLMVQSYELVKTYTLLAERT